MSDTPSDTPMARQYEYKPSTPWPMRDTDQSQAAAAERRYPNEIHSFLCDPSDIEPVLHTFGSSGPLKFVDPAILPTPNRDIFLSPSQIPSPGISTCERGGGSKSYIVSLRDPKNYVREFTDVNGRRRWLVSNGDNTDTVVMTLAGLWHTGTLLPGSVTTLHKTAAAQQLMRSFLRALRQEGFVQIDPWWLGREAMAMLKAGKRLSMTAEQSPPEFDLKLPDGASRHAG